MKKVFVEIISWIAVVALLVAYFLVSLGLIKVGILYHIINAFGSVGIIIVSLHKHIYSLVVFNIIWLTVALYAIVKLKGDF